jgi:hypothetical protein
VASGKRSAIGRVSAFSFDDREGRLPMIYNHRKKLLEDMTLTVRADRLLLATCGSLLGSHWIVAMLVWRSDAVAVLIARQLAVSSSVSQLELAGPADRSNALRSAHVSCYRSLAPAR